MFRSYRLIACGIAAALACLGSGHAHADPSALGGELTYLNKPGDAAFTINSPTAICRTLEHPIFSQPRVFQLLANQFPNPRDVRRLIDWDPQRSAEAWDKRTEFRPDLSCFEGGLCRTPGDIGERRRWQAGNAAVRSFLNCMASIKRADPHRFANLTTYFLPMDAGCSSEGDCVSRLVFAHPDCMGCASYNNRARRLFAMLVVSEAEEPLRQALDEGLIYIRQVLAQLDRSR